MARRRNAADRERIYRILDQVFGAEESREGMVRAMRVMGEWPEEVWALSYPAEGRFYALKIPEDTCEALVVVGSEELATVVIEAMPDEWAEGCVPRCMSFDEAREVAKTRDCDALILIDDPDSPLVHYVR